MKNILKKYNNNYLIIYGAALFCCTLILFLVLSFFNEEKILHSSRTHSIDNFKVFIFLTLIVAPIIEEISFRGIYLNKIIPKVISILGIAFYLIITNNLYLYVFFIIYIALLSTKYKNTQLTFYLNALIFSLVHYKLSDFSSIFSIIPMFFQFSLGLILIWVVLNFNLIKAMIFHFFINFIGVIIFTIPLQFPDKKIFKTEYQNYKMEWQRVPILQQKGINIKRLSEFEIKAENINLNKFYKLFTKKEELLKIKNEHIYKIEIKTLNNSAQKLDSKIIKELLLKADLIYKN